MSTPSEIRIARGKSFTFVSVNFDGYPDHMLPALDALDATLGPDELAHRLIGAGEVRSIDANRIEAYADARPARVDTLPEGHFCFTYARGDKGWELV